MRIIIALTLLLAGVVAAGGAISASRALPRTGRLVYPPLVAYFSLAAACIGEAGWLLSGQAL